MQTIQLTFTKGIYDLLKDHLRTNNKLSNFNKQRLEEDLKSPRLLSGKEMPGDVVNVNTRLQLTEVETNEVLNFDLVAPGEAKVKHNKLSVLSPIGVALLGYGEGHEVQWEMPEGFKTYKIEKVMAIK